MGGGGAGTGIYCCPGGLTLNHLSIWPRLPAWRRLRVQLCLRSEPRVARCSPARWAVCWRPATAVCSSFIAAGFGGTMRAKIPRQSFFYGRDRSAFPPQASLPGRPMTSCRVQMLIVLGLQMLIKAPITAWAITKIAGKRWEWTAATGAAILVLLAVVGICLLIATPRFRRMQRLTDDLNRVSRENLSGLSVVRAYNAEAYQQIVSTSSTIRRSPTTSCGLSNHGLPHAHHHPGATMSGLVARHLLDWRGSYQQRLMADKIALFSDMMVFSPVRNHGGHGVHDAVRSS